MIMPYHCKCFWTIKWSVIFYKDIFFSSIANPSICMLAPLQFYLCYKTRFVAAEEKFRNANLVPVRQRRQIWYIQQDQYRREISETEDTRSTPTYNTTTTSVQIQNNTPGKEILLHLVLRGLTGRRARLTWSRVASRATTTADSSSSQLVPHWRGSRSRHQRQHHLLAHSRPCWEYALEAIIKWFISIFMFTIIVYSPCYNCINRKHNTCVEYKQPVVPSKPLPD